MTVEFYTSDYSRKWPKNFKFFLVYALNTLCMNWNKLFEKKQKWQNLTIFRKFLPKFTSAYVWKSNALKYAVIWQKNGKKWQLCFTPQIIAENDQKNSKMFLVNVSGTHRTNCHKLFEKNQKW